MNRRPSKTGCPCHNTGHTVISHIICRIPFVRFQQGDCGEGVFALFFSYPDVCIFAPGFHLQSENKEAQEKARIGAYSSK